MQKLGRLLPILSGLILAASLFDGLEPLVVVGLIPLFYFWSQPHLQLKKYFLSGFIAEFVFMSVAFYWIQNAGKSYFLLNPFSSFLFYLVFISMLSLQWGIIGLIFGYFNRLYPGRMIFFLPYFMILLDEIVFRFFPFHFGFHWYARQLPGLSWASFIGLSGLGFLVLCINLFLTLIIQKRAIRFSTGGLLLVFIFLFLAPKINTEGDRFQVLGVQGNISNEVKRTDLQAIENKMMTVDRYYSLTRKGLKENAEMNFDLVVWPETTLPFVWKTGASENKLDALQADVLAFSNRIEKPILSGSYFDDSGNYNAVIYATPDKVFQHSEKKYLFPIGEVIPFNDFWGLTKNMFPEVPRFKSEKQPTVLKTKSFNTVVPICYEGLFSEYFEGFQQPIEFIVSISNDGWFESPLQKKWHALIAMSRSVEYRVPVLRVTNDGASGSAEANGSYRFVQRDQSVAFANSFRIERKQEKTWMQKNGEIVNRIPRFLSYVVVLFLLGVAFKRRSVKNN